METLTVGELIEYLELVGKDKYVYIARDEEGNGFGTILKSTISVASDKVIIFPCEEFLELN